MSLCAQTYKRLLLHMERGHLHSGRDDTRSGTSLRRVLPAELEPESGRLWIMGGMTEKEDYQKVCPTEMMILSFNDQREPLPLRLLAMEWAVKHTFKEDKRLLDLPGSIMKELESRQSWMGKQKISKLMK